MPKNSNLLAYPAGINTSESQPRIGHPFIELQSVDSTNNYAMEQVYALLAHHGSTWFAHHQFAGKGQRGKTWQSDPGESIIMSVALDPKPFNLTQQFMLNTAVALAARELLVDLGIANVSIKWPNDIYVDDRKAGGILIENIVQGNNWAWAIAGIGINVNQAQFAENIGRPVSIHQITQKKYDCVLLAKQLCGTLQKYWQILLGGDQKNLLELYNNRLYKRGEKVKLKKDNYSFETTIGYVSADGLLHTTDVLERTFRVGDIEWIF